MLFSPKHWSLERCRPKDGPCFLLTLFHTPTKSCLNLYVKHYLLFHYPSSFKKNVSSDLFWCIQFYTAFKLLRSRWSSYGHQLGIATSGVWEIFKWATSLLTHYILQPFEIPQKTFAFKDKSKQLWLLFLYAH